MILKAKLGESRPRVLAKIVKISGLRAAFLHLGLKWRKTDFQSFVIPSGNRGHS